MKYHNGKVKNPIPFKIASKKKNILRNKPDQGDERLIC